MKRSIARRLARRKQRIARRLERANQNKYRRCALEAGPVLNPPGVKYELADKTQAISYGGVGLMIELAREVGLVEAIDRRLHLLKRHVPYHVSSHGLHALLPHGGRAEEHLAGKGGSETVR